MTQRRNRDDALTTKSRPSPFGFESRSTKRLQAQILEAVNRMGGVGPKAEEQYQQSLNALREEKDAVRVLMAEYEACPNRQYLDRWSLVQLLSELRVERTLEFFDKVVRARLPAVTKRDSHAFNPLREELIIRTTAIDAVAKFAADGNEDARKMLLGYTGHRNLSICRAAVMAFRAHGTDMPMQATRILRKELPEERHFLLEIKRLKEGELPPIDGERFLGEDAGGVADDTPRVVPAPDPNQRRRARFRHARFQGPLTRTPKLQETIMATCTATVPDMNASGDNLYGPHCAQVYIDYFWHAYGFNGNKRYWDDGFGWHDPCNSRKPLARTFNACYALTYSADDWENDNWDAPQNVLQWGRRYVRENINDLRSLCGDGGAVASAPGSRVELYLAFWYEFTVPERAAILIHEARHHGGKPHNANFPPGSVFGAGDQADSDWDYQGAWTFETGYLIWFAQAGARTTSAMRDRARQAANVNLDNAFATHPGFNV